MGQAQRLQYRARLFLGAAAEVALETTAQAARVARVGAARAAHGLLNQAAAQVVRLTRVEAAVAEGVRGAVRLAAQA